MSIHSISEENGTYRFTLAGINVSLANAIRRTILADIPINVIRTETHDINQCHITINTGRLHNEILKQRLSCIPIHMKDLDVLPSKYTLELDVTNETEEIMYVTTESFKIRNKTNDNLLKQDEVMKIFPPDNRTNYYIDFARLRPRISDSIPGEQLKLTAEFSVSTAGENSMFNVVSKCAYSNTIDMAKVAEVWSEKEATMQESKEEIAFAKRNFYILDAQRHFVPDSFDFVVQSLGIYENAEIVKKACAILQHKFVALIEGIDSNTVPVNYSETTMEYCFDIILEHEDYTVGKILEYLLYETHFMGDKTLTFCGFKKFHPHNEDSTLRIAFVARSDKPQVDQYLREACVDAGELCKSVFRLF